MKDFMLIFKGGEYQSLTKEEMQEDFQAWGKWTQLLKEKKYYKSGDPLERSGKVIDGKDRIVTDGPFSEAKELIGGYIIVPANDYDEAVNIAKDCPILNINGRVEVREVMAFKM
jgi:hypothetical protein